MTLLSQKLESINRVVRNAAAQTATDTVTGDSKDTSSNSISGNGIGSGADQVNAASDSQKVESKAPAIDELSLDNEETDDNRNKR